MAAEECLQKEEEQRKESENWRIVNHSRKKRNNAIRTRIWRVGESRNRRAWRRWIDKKTDLSEKPGKRTVLEQKSEIW